MSLTTLFLQTITPLFLIIGATVAISRYAKVDTGHLSRASIYLFTPALAFSSIAAGEMDLGEVGGLIVAGTLASAGLAPIALLLARVAGLERGLANTFALTIFLMNSGNFGLPFIEFTFGTAGLQRAVAFVAGVALTINSVGIYVASRGQSSVRDSLLNVVRTPLVYAVVLALLFNGTGTRLPLPLERAVVLLGQAAVPLQLVVLGLQLAALFRRPTGSGRALAWWPLALSTVSRFGLGALAGFAIAALFGFSGVTRQVVILESAMPVAVFSGILAEEFGSEPEFAAAAILTSTLASVFVLAGLLALMQ